MCVYVYIYIYIHICIHTHIRISSINRYVLVPGAFAHWRQATLLGVETLTSNMLRSESMRVGRRRG